MGKPYYIALDGPDGCGKTTQLKMLSECLAGNGIAHERIREPGQTVGGAEIRGVLLNGEAAKFFGKTEAFLFSADRCQTSLEVTRPALEAGKWVLSDRSFLTTTVYQGHARGLDLNELETMHALAVGNVRPDLQIVLNVSAEVGLARKGKQLIKGVEDRFESMGDTFQNAVRDGFAAEAAKRPNVVIIEANGTPEQVHEQVLGVIRSRLGVPLQVVEAAR
jgi:dTMP kinase